MVIPASRSAIFSPRLLITVATRTSSLSWPASFERHGQDGHDLVAVHDVALVVNGQAAVGVAVVGYAQVGAVGHHGGLQLLQMRGADAVVDVDARPGRHR